MVWLVERAIICSPSLLISAQETIVETLGRRAINAKIDSVIRATPGHLLFTEEQRKVYTTIGGCHHLDGVYTIYGEVTEGLELIDQIATQPKDQYDRPKKDIRINKISIL